MCYSRIGRRLLSCTKLESWICCTVWNLLLCDLNNCGFAWKNSKRKKTSVKNILPCNHNFICHNTILWIFCLQICFFLSVASSAVMIFICRIYFYYCLVTWMSFKLVTASPFEGAVIFSFCLKILQTDQFSQLLFPHGWLWGKRGNYKKGRMR